MLDMQEEVADYVDDASNMFWLYSGKAAVKMGGLAEYSTIDKFGQAATNSTAGFVS